MKNLKRGLFLIFALTLLVGLYSLSTMVMASDVKVPVDKAAFFKTPANIIQTPPTTYVETEVYFNLTTEELVVGEFKMEGYALNGKWKAGTLEAGSKEISSFLKRGGTIAITDKMDEKGKEPHRGVGTKGDEVGEVSGFVITLKKIDKRPGKPRLVVNYIEYASDYGLDNGAWTLSDRSKPNEEYASIGNVVYIKPEDNKKLTDEERENWRKFPSDGIAVENLGFGDKVGGKHVYFIKEIAYTKDGKYVPSSPEVKISASALLKAPNLKPDYKNGNVRVKAGLAFITATDSNIKYGKTKNDARGIVALPTTSPTISELVYEPSANTEQRYIELYTYATDKRPASAHLRIDIAKAASAPGTGTVDVDEKGKVSMDSSYEATKTYTNPIASANVKWGKSYKVTPKTSGKEIFFIRVRNSAKSTKADDMEPIGKIMGYDGELASAVKKVAVYWGKDADNNNKPYVVGVTVVAYDATVPDTFTP